MNTFPSLMNTREIETVYIINVKNMLKMFRAYWSKIGYIEIINGFVLIKTKVLNDNSFPFRPKKISLSLPSESFHFMLSLFDKM